MPNVKVTLYFSHGKFGASESYYWNPEDLISHDHFAFPLQQWVERRNNLLDSNHQIDGVRVATTASPKVSRLFVPGLNVIKRDPLQDVSTTIPLKGGYTSGSSTTPSWDQFRSVLHVRVTTADGKSSLRYMSGIPDITSGTEPATLNSTAPAAWWDKFREFERYSGEEGFSVQHSAQDRNTGYADIEYFVSRATAPNLLGLVVVGDSWNPAVGASAPGCQLSGQRLKASAGFKLAGHYKVAAVATESGRRVIYLQDTDGAALAYIRSPGRVRTTSFGTSPIVSMTPIRVGIRQRGNGSNRVVGRRRNLPRLTAE